MPPALTSFGAFHSDCSSQLLTLLERRISQLCNPPWAACPVPWIVDKDISTQLHARHCIVCADSAHYVHQGAGSQLWRNKAFHQLLVNLLASHAPKQASRPSQIVCAALYAALKLTQ